MKNLKLFLPAALGAAPFLFVVAALGAEPNADNGPMIRIAIVRDIDRVLIKTGSAYEISDPLTREVLEKGMRFPATTVTKGEKGLKLGKRELPVSRIRFYSRRDVSVYPDSKEYRYRGYVDVILTPKGQLLLVNQLEIEDYIRGVLYHEVSNRWPMESLKAQAVAARSYAMYQVKMNLGKEFDLTNDVYSQVYGGRSGERYRTNLAVDQTKGVVLLYQGKVLPAYFHATCGGHTEDGKELWPRQDLAPLKGVRCIYCRESPHYFWKQNLTHKDIQDRLNAHGYKIGAVDDVAITQRDVTDRIQTLLITDHDGKQITISGKDFREAIGPNVIRSNNYYVVMQEEDCDFFGKGWGHGVGMCQWGAQGMASLGFTYDKILKFYYPGTVLGRSNSAGSTR